MHAQHVHISFQLLASLLHFIIASVSALMVSAVQIQMMDCLNEGWSLYTKYIALYLPTRGPRVGALRLFFHFLGRESFDFNVRPGQRQVRGRVELNIV